MISQEKPIEPFYFPDGKPLSREERQNIEVSIQKAFEKGNDIQFEDFEPITVDVCKLPKICKKLLWEKIIAVEKLQSDTTKISK